MIYEDFESSNVMFGSDAKLKYEYVIDLGCSFHMYPNNGWFQKLTKVGGKDLLGNNH